jgi:hypothetical protein
LKSRMWEIYKYGSVRGIVFLHVYIELTNSKGEIEMSTRQNILFVREIAPF